jgi:amidase
LQLVGRHLGEATLIQAGAAFERATEWHNQRPPQSAD